MSKRIENLRKELKDYNDYDFESISEINARLDERKLAEKEEKEKVERLKLELRNKNAKFGNYSIGNFAYLKSIEIIDEIFGDLK